MEQDTIDTREPSGSTQDVRREDRRKAILDAAEALFLEQGFAKVSFAAIIRRSGGSLATAYELFGNKHGLLRAVVERDKYEGMEDIEAIMAETESAAEILRLITRRVHAHIMTPRATAMWRIVIGESLNDPEFARAFYREVHLKRVADLADVFRSWNEDGRAHFDDPEAAAELYLAMMVADLQMCALTGVMAELDQAIHATRVEWRLDIFLRQFDIR